MAHVAKWKKARVEDLTKMLMSKPVIGIVDIEGIPSSQLQQIRKNIPKGSKFMIAKNTLIKLALKEASKEKKNLNELADTLDGQRGVIASEVNPFRLFRVMESTMIKAPARGGEIAPEDIEVKEGETPFKPGPVVGELQKAGFPAAIEKGKVVIKSDKVLVKKGKRIPTEIARLLTKLEIYPLTVGLSLKAGFEDGMIFTKDVLDVDVDAFIKEMGQASVSAFNLSMFIGYPTKSTMKPLLQLAHQNAFNLAFCAKIPTKDTISLLITKAQGQAMALASHVPDATASKKKEES